MRAIVSASAEATPQFYDLDPLNIVWHGHYPRFLELGRVAVMDKIGYGYAAMAESGFAWPFSDYRMRFRCDSSGRKSALRTARVTAGLAMSNRPTELFGSMICVRVARGATGVPDRVGVAFFHCLTGCRVLWDCGARTWTMSIP